MKLKDMDLPDDDPGRVRELTQEEVNLLTTLMDMDGNNVAEIRLTFMTGHSTFTVERLMN